MEKIKFRIHRTFYGYLIYQLLFQSLPILIEISIYLLAKQHGFIEGFYILLLLLLPWNIICMLRDTVVIKGNKLIIKTAYMPACEYTANITTVSNVHYREKLEGVTWGSAGVFFVALAKREYTVCFIDHKDRPYQISTKDHAKLYAILKAREKVN